MSGCAVPFLVRHTLKPRSTMRRWLHSVALVVVAAAGVASVVLVRASVGVGPLNGRWAVCSRGCG
jgi:hypothetical protein